jgi:hypothetical protein
VRIIGLILLIGGFLWITKDVFLDFTATQHMVWIWHVQHLPSGEVIARTDAIRALATLTQSGVDLDVVGFPGGAKALNADMRVGGIQETITVTGETPFSRSTRAIRGTAACGSSAFG